MLIFLALIFLLGYWVGKSSVNKASQTPDQSYWLQQIIDALVFRARTEIDNAKSKTTKDALQRVIDAGYETQYGYVPGAESEAKPAQATAPAQTSATTASVASQSLQPNAQYQQGPNLVQKTPTKQDLDNTSLLLYFGAFLFITSVGLFVGFADIEGFARTLAVALVAIVMYGTGMWFFNTKKKLQEVGISFIAIGMSTIPFIGVATYYYDFDQSYGPAIWMLTSLGTMLVYLVTLFKIRNTFISYMLIASIISLFESSVGILELPAYYYVWMLIVVGIVLQFVSFYSEKIPELRDSSAQSARVLVPLTLGASFLIVGNEGYWQLAVSLMLGSFYYVLQYYIATVDRWMYSMTAHALAITGLSLGAFAVNEVISDVSGVLLLITGVHALLALTMKVSDSLVFQRFLDVSMLTAGATVIIGINDALHLTLALGLAIFVGAIVAIRTTRHDAFVLTVTAWVIFSVVVGQVYPDHSVSSLTQALLSFSFVIPLVLLIHDKSINALSRAWIDTLKTGIIALHAIAMVFSYVHGEYSVLFISMLAVANAILLAETRKSRGWVDVAVAYTLVPFGYVIMVISNEHLRSLPLFTWSVVAALAINIAIALHYKNETARWVSSAAWLALPFALGIEEIGAFSLSATLQMWLYLTVAIALSISRAIARGRLLSSKHATLQSLAKDSSASYEFGLAIAALIAIVLSFVSTESVAASTLVIVLAGIILTAGGTIIERTPQYVAVIPFVLQVALLRLLEPYDAGGWLSSNENIVHVYVLLSTVLSLLIYVWTTLTETVDANKHYIKAIRDSAVSTTLIAPFSFLLLGEVVWAMPVALILASMVFLHYRWSEQIGQRESIGFMALAGIYWLMYLLGVRNIQAYTHVLAGLFGLYGYIRYIRKDEIKSNEYLGYMLGVATIPLALQALSGGDNADIYGLWLLLENVAFMLVGITIRNRLVTRWGLYAAVASVLYQLRGLGWAMLSVLALFIIGVAIYRALNQPDEEE